MQHRAFTLTLAAVATIAIGCYTDKTTTAPKTTGTTTSTTPAAPVNNNVTFTATMTGAKENPANASTGTGTFTATNDTVTNIFSYDVTFTGLTSAVNNGHIHGPAASATVNSGTTINFNTQAGANFSFGQTSGTAHGIALLTAATQITATINGDSLKKLFFAGLTYANIHTTAFGGGEIRGTITKQ